MIAIQARDLTEDGEIGAGGFAVLSAPPGGATLLCVGDIIFQPRGLRYAAAVFGGFGMMAIAAAPLCILRMKEGMRVHPEYLAAVLRSASVQADLRNAAVGTHVPQVQRTELAELDIPVPDLSTQMQLLEFDHLVREEAHLMAELRSLRARSFDEALAIAARRTQGRTNAPGF